MKLQLRHISDIDADVTQHPNESWEAFHVLSIRHPHLEWQRDSSPLQTLETDDGLSSMTKWKQLFLREDFRNIKGKIVHKWDFYAETWWKKIFLELNRSRNEKRIPVWGGFCVWKFSPVLLEVKQTSRLTIMQQDIQINLLPISEWNRRWQNINFHFDDVFFLRDSA